MRSNSPTGSVFALDLSGLLASDVTVWTAWRDDRLAAIGALRMLGGGQAEIKSMRTHPDHLRTGAGTAMLRYLLRIAQDRGVARVSLETGSGEAFEPALALYRRHGFVEGAAFGDYAKSAFNRFLHLNLG